jgi:tetratricopeptide (TPR) repeat protein
VGRVIHRLAGASVALLAAGCAHIPWADDPSAEPPKVCADLSVRSVPPQAETLVLSGQAQYCQGLYAPAAATFAEVIEKEDSAPADRAAALRWLVFTHRRFPGWEWIVNTVGQADPSELDAPQLADVRDDLHLLAAKFEYQVERFDEALALLGTIPASSPLHVRAALLTGAVQVRAGAPDLAQAAFTEALRAAPADADPKRARERDLAVISLARLHYAMEQFEIASRYYESLPATSAYAIPAALEGGWSRFQMKDLPRALMLSRSVETRSREVPPDTMAEALVLEATIALQQGWKEAMTIIRQFDEVYPAVFVQTKQLSRYEPDALFDVAFSVRAGGALSPPLGREQTLLLLADVPVARRFDELEELSREQAVFGSRGRIPGAALDPTEVDLLDRREAVAREAGDLFLHRLQRARDRLAGEVQEAARIEYQAIHLEQAGLRRLW